MSREAQILRFLRAEGWDEALHLPLAGDASGRRYLRLLGEGRSAILMDAPPSEPVQPFLDIAGLLRGWGCCPPAILAAAPEDGLALLEDLGDALVGPELAAGRADEREVYAVAVELLAGLHRRRPPAWLPPYDDAFFERELTIFLDYEAPHASPERRAAFLASWRPLLAQARIGAPCLVYRDFHALNLIWRPERQGTHRLALLDFQGALVGPCAYDLASLLEDARRDVPVVLAREMLDRYLALRPELDREPFEAAFAIMATQRNMKILGLFTRLARLHGKTQYLTLKPRVAAYLARDLAHPALAPVRGWCAEAGLGLR